MASVSMEDMKKMKVADLKKELKERGLALTGTKDVLLERLEEHLGEAAPPAADSSQVESVQEEVDPLVESTKPDAVTVAAVPPPAPVTSKENIPKIVIETGSGDEPKKIEAPSKLTEAERIKARADRFGATVSESSKKLQRAERFGLPVAASKGSNKIAATPATAEDLEKMKKRAERFGTVVSNKLSKVDEDEKKKKRMARFGATLATDSETPAKKVKLDSAGATEETDEQKKKRAERFGLTT